MTPTWEGLEGNIGNQRLLDIDFFFPAVNFLNPVKKYLMRDSSPEVPRIPFIINSLTGKGVAMTPAHQ